MPRPQDSRRRYLPGLDGIRAIAVLALLGAGLGLSGLSGGGIGYSVFFALSGYLITDLLLAGVRSGRVDLRSFWVGRAQRILPALAAMLAVTLAWVTVLGPQQAPGLQSVVVTSVASVNNLWVVAKSSSYLGQFQAPEPFDHLWALSIVVQFYLVWPLILMVGLRIAPGVKRGSGARPALCVLIVGLAAASLALAAVLYSEANPIRAYYGTGCRAAEILIGAAAAAVYPSARPQATQRRRGALIDVLGFAGLAVIVAMVLAEGAVPPSVFRAGFAVAAIAATSLIVAAVHPGSLTSRLLGTRILVWIGARSYGIFLWHLPIITLTSPDGYAGADPLRSALQAAATFVVAALSWRYVEEPVRHGWLGRNWARVRAGTVRPRKTAQASLMLAGAVIGAACVGLAGAATSPRGDPEQAATNSSRGPTGAATNSSAALQDDIELSETESSGDVIFTAHTSCGEVVHLGDSTSAGLVSDDLLPERDQIGAQYEVIGVSRRHLEVSSPRLISDHFDTEPQRRGCGRFLELEGLRWMLGAGAGAG